MHRQPFMVQSGDVPSLTTHLAVAALQPQGKGGRVAPCLALGYDDGSADVHLLADAFARAQDVQGEVRVLQQLLGIAPS